MANPEEVKVVELLEREDVEVREVVTVVETPED